MKRAGTAGGGENPSPNGKKCAGPPVSPGELPQPAQNVCTPSSASQSFQSRWWVSFGLPKAGADGEVGPCVTMKHALDEFGAQASSAVVAES